MDSLIPILAITPPSAIFFIFAAVLFLNWNEKKDRETMYFAIAFFSMGLCFGMWVVRTLLYPPYVDLSEVDILIRLGYLFGIVGVVFIGLSAIVMVNPSLIKKKFFIAPAFFLAILITFIAQPIPTTIAEQTDFVWSSEVAFITSLVGLFYLMSTNYLFIWWMMKNKDNPLYKKIRLMEIGLLIFCAGTIIEASKFGMESFGILIRWATALGGAIMMYAYTKK